MRDPDGLETAVELRGVSAVRGGRTIWRNANFAVPRGSFTAVIGSNGAGKSTLISLLLGRVKPSAGNVQVLGGSVASGNPAVGLVPQDRSLENAGSVLCRDLVALGLVGPRWGLGLRSRSVDAAVSDALEAVDATSYADRRFGEVSGGQQKRISIAQALITKPALLLLDEPLAGLDLQGQVDIVELVHHINHDRNVTVLFVTHDLNPLLAHIDSVLYLLDGTLRFGAADQVVDAELLTALYGTPVQVTRTADGCVFTRTE
jgi:zinc/manganese transport system ATP-binding protein